MNVLLNNSLFKALGMTIIHSIWQALAVFLIVRLVLYILKRSTSVVKYRILGFSLLAIFLISAVTFTYYKNKYQLSFISHPAKLNLSIAGNSFKDSAIAGDFQLKLSISSILSQLNSSLPYIVSIYLIGVLILSLRLLFNLHFIRRIRRFGVAVEDLELQQKFKNLKSRILPGNEKVKLIESALIKVPIVIGYLKPMVIVPIGIFTQIPYNQLEAILAHELAHIKRHDFLINILQSVVEILLFYHPVIYLISNRMRSERENCCDDFALDYCSNTQYAKALATMETMRIRNSFPAVAFVKHKENLLKRIQRILKQENMKTKMTDRLFAGFIILSGLITILLTGSAGLNNDSVSTQNIEFSMPVATGTNQLMDAPRPLQVVDTSLNIEENTIDLIMKDEDGNEHIYRMDFENDKLSSLYVDGKKIPKKDHVLYKDLISKTLSDVKKAKKEISEIDEEEIKAEVEAAMKEIENLDIEKIQKEVMEASLEAKKSMENINLDSILQEVNVALASVSTDINIDFENFSVDLQAEIENAMKEIENIDMDEIRKDLEEAKIKIELDMKDLDFEEIQRTIEESLSEIDFEKIKADMDDLKIEIEIEEKKINKVEKSLENTLEEMKAE